MVPGLDHLRRALSATALASASRTIFLDVAVRQAARGLDADRLLLAGRLVLGADIDRPLASMSKVTSTCGMPRGPAAAPTRSELAEQLVVGGHPRSP